MVHAYATVNHVENEAVVLPEYKNEPPISYPKLIFAPHLFITGSEGEVPCNIVPTPVDGKGQAPDSWE